MPHEVEAAPGEQFAGVPPRSCLSARPPFAAGADAPGLFAGLGDDSAPGLGDGDKMFEDQRIVAPGERLIGVANSLILFGIRILHEDGAAAVWPQLRTEGAIGLP